MKAEEEQRRIRREEFELENFVLKFSPDGRYGSFMLDIKRKVTREWYYNDEVECYALVEELIDNEQFIQHESFAPFHRIIFFDFLLEVIRKYQSLVANNCNDFDEDTERINMTFYKKVITPLRIIARKNGIETPSKFMYRYF